MKWHMGTLGGTHQQLHERGFKGTKNCSLLEAPKMHSPKYSFQTPLHILGLHVLYSHQKTMSECNMLALQGGKYGCHSLSPPPNFPSVLLLDAKEEEKGIGEEM